MYIKCKRSLFIYIVSNVKIGKRVIKLKKVILKLYNMPVHLKEVNGRNIKLLFMYYFLLHSNTFFFNCKQKNI